MNDADKELCQELYELSGWHDTFAWYSGDTVEFEGEAGYEGSVYENTMQYDWCTNIPAYSLSYLLRKLPEPINLTKGAGQYAAWLVDGEQRAYCKADTPENAACKLAIELFKQGVLK